MEIQGILNLKIGVDRESSLSSELVKKMLQKFSWSPFRWKVGKPWVEIDKRESDLIDITSYDWGEAELELQIRNETDVFLFQSPN
jgi:hypothetical protein